MHVHIYIQYVGTYVGMYVHTYEAIVTVRIYFCRYNYVTTYIHTHGIMYVQYVYLLYVICCSKILTFAFFACKWDLQKLNV